ncbi:hypothetical protein I547_7759 [Mycobacterium kansasii 824]|nr:hypothetical protein I547_7759 [Mycobacterium kansasii 824]
MAGQQAQMISALAQQGPPTACQPGRSGHQRRRQRRRRRRRNHRRACPVDDASRSLQRRQRVL